MTSDLDHFQHMPLRDLCCGIHQSPERLQQKQSRAVTAMGVANQDKSGGNKHYRITRQSLHVSVVISKREAQRSLVITAVKACDQEQAQC